MSRRSPEQLMTPRKRIMGAAQNFSACAGAQPRGRAALDQGETQMRIAYRMAAALLGAASLAVFAATPCCDEEDFRGVGQSPDGVKIQLTEVKRTSPEDIRVTWTLKNTTQKPQLLT